MQVGIAVVDAHTHTHGRHSFQQNCPGWRAGGDGLLLPSVYYSPTNPGQIQVGLDAARADRFLVCQEWKEFF